MINFKDKYSDLYDAVKNIPLRKTEVISTEQRSDDYCSLLYPAFDNSDLSLFLLAQKESPNGFIESYCLSKESIDRINKIRNKFDSTPSWEKSLIETLEQYLQIPYSKFSKLPFDSQTRIVDNIKHNQSREEWNVFQQRITNIIEESLNAKILKRTNNK